MADNAICKIIALNVNSIYTIQRRDAIADFLNLHNPQMLLLSETKLTQKCRVSFAGYTCVRNDRETSTSVRPNGGTAIVIANTIKFEHIRLPAQSFLEKTVIRVELASQKKLFVISAYGKTAESSVFNTDFADLFCMLDLSNVNNYYIMAGDLNAKHRSWRNLINNGRGNAIYSWLQDHGMQFRSQLYHTSLPTFDRGSSYLDIAIADARVTFATTVTAAESNNHDEHGLLLLPFDSDHGAIQMNIALEDDDVFMRRHHIGRHRYDTVDWQSFNSQLYLALNRNRRVPGATIVPADRNINDDEIDTYVNVLQSSVADTIDRHVKRTREATSSNKFVNWRIKLLKRRKNEVLHAIFDVKKQQPHLTSIAHLRRLKSELAHLQKLIKDNFRKSINGYWQSVFENISPTNAKHMLPTINRIFRPKSHASIQPLQLSPTVAGNVIDDLQLTPLQYVAAATAGDITVHDTTAMLRVLGYKFAAVNVQNRDLGTVGHARQIVAEREQFIGNTVQQPLVYFTAEHPADRETIDGRFATTAEVLALCRATNNKRSTGVDNIPNIVIRHMPRFLAREYGVLFNHCINNGFFPAAWKIGRVFPLLKKDKDPAQPSSYRPITLLPNISKIFEKIVQRQMNEYADEHHILPDSQFGFRRGHSTVHALTKLLSDVCWHKNNRSGVGACLIDTEKAFDTVWLDGLIVKMMRYRFPEHIITMLCKMLYGKRFCVAAGQTTTEAEFSIADGLQQGTVLAPILFAIYTAELLNDAVFAEPGNAIIAYADDLIVYASGARAVNISARVQRLVDTVSCYFTTWKQRLNPSKCEAILFRAPLRRGPADFERNWKRFSVDVGGHRLDTKMAVTYLGVRLLNTGGFNDHCRIQQSKARRAFFTLRNIFYSKHIDMKVKVICYASLLRPMLTYACPAWFTNVDVSVMEEYRRFERRCLRCCATIGSRSASSEYRKYHANQTLYDHINVTRIDNHIVKLARDHFARLGSIANASVAFSARSATGLYIQRCMRSGFIPPESCIYLDSAGYIQDANGIPVLYHIRRDHPKASINYNAVQNCATADRELVIFDIAIPPCDVPDGDKLRERYWWMQ